MGDRKQSYSLLSNIYYTLKVYWNERKSLIIFAIIGVIMRVALPFASIMMSKLVIDELTSHAAAEHFITVIGGMALLLVVLNFFKSYTDTKIDENFGNVGSIAFALYAEEKLTAMDYELLEDPGVKRLEDKAGKAAQSNHTLACNLLRVVSVLLVNIFGLLLYGSIITAIHPLIIVLLAVSAAINWKMLSYSRKYEKGTREERAKLVRKLDYINNSLSNRNMAKDMRLYSMVDWLMKLSIVLMTEKQRAEGKVANRNMLAQLTDGLLILIRDGAAYAFLVFLLIQGQIALGDFVLMFAAIGSFAGWISGILLQSSDLLRASSEMSDFRTFVDLPDKSNTGSGVTLPPADKAPDIRIENVSYTYPGAAGPALENISVHIRQGERIAIVGKNGSGKTTFVKLVCGLYRPQTGCILLADTDIRTFNRDEYYTLLSAVFQDIHLITTSIAGNISQQIPQKTDRAKVEQCLKLAGLYDKVQSLPEGMDTLLVRQVNENAIELSGGEKQKLALARALYKDAPVIILDEPTAALDPIAENEQYQQYASLTRGKTSIYISHRLASTRFCDRILFMDGHRIVETGTHDELMKYGGQYAAMFAIQASYYNDRREEVGDV